MSTAMCDVFQMFKRMTSRAEDFEVSSGVVFWVPVTMVYTQYLWFRRIAATLTCADVAPAKHPLACSGKRRFPFGLVTFVDAGFAAINPVMGWRSSKVLAAMTAYDGDRTLEMLRLVIAMPRAILGGLLAIADNSESLRTDLTGYWPSFMLRFPAIAATARTEAKSLPSMAWNAALRFAFHALEQFVGNTLASRGCSVMTHSLCL